MEPKKTLTGIVTFKELYTYFGVSDKTMKAKLEPLRLFLNCPGKRKRTYTPNEVEFILQQLDRPNRNGSDPSNIT